MGDIKGNNNPKEDNKNILSKSLKFIDELEEIDYNFRKYRTYWKYRRFKNYIDFIIIDTIITYAVLIVGSIIYLATYKSKVIDPILNIKKAYISASCITIFILTIITLLITIFSKNKKSLFKRLLVLFSISIITTMVVIGIRINMDNKYSKLKFEQIYNEQNIEDSDEKIRINFSIDNFGFISEKDYYINEYVKIYNMFKIKTYGIFALYIMLDILLIYQVIKVLKIKENLDKIAKDDIVLFDEEENIKF